MGGLQWCPRDCRRNVTGDSRRRRLAAQMIESTRLSRGFTLVELMVTLAVAAILITIAVPSFSTIIANNRLNTAANELVGAISTARMQAIQLNAGAQFCSNLQANNTSDTLGTACGTNAGAVYALNNNVAAPVRAAPVGLATPVVLSGAAADIVAIRFNGQGQGFAAGAPGIPFNGPVADICIASLKSGNHRVISMAAGSVITTTTTTGTCP